MTQYRYESSSWKRVLEFIKQENIQTKDHLADILRLSDRKDNYLEDVEYLINNVLQIEAAASLLSRDIEAYEKLLAKEFYVDGLTKSIACKRQAIVENIKHLEDEFRKLKDKIESFLTNTLL